jgi:uncharacterized protein YjbI with pentapeptide repeats
VKNRVLTPHPWLLSLLLTAAVQAPIASQSHAAKPAPPANSLCPLSPVVHVLSAYRQDRPSWFVQLPTEIQQLYTHHRPDQVITFQRKGLFGTRSVTGVIEGFDPATQSIRLRAIDQPRQGQLALSLQDLDLAVTRLGKVDPKLAPFSPQDLVQLKIGDKTVLGRIQSFTQDGGLVFIHDGTEKPETYLPNQFSPKTAKAWDVEKQIRLWAGKNPMDTPALLNLDSRLPKSKLTHGSFEGGDLQHTSFLEAKIPELQLASANLFDSSFDYSELPDAALQNANLSDSRIHYTDFTGSDLTGARLQNIECFRCGFKSANLYLVNMQGAKFEVSDFSHADLRRADLRGATFIAPTMIQADLRGADLRGVDLSSANLNGANLEGALMDSETKLPPARPGELRRIK